MIRPSQSSNLLIDVTNACHLHCSNCTRLLDHAKVRYFMSPECFERALVAVKDFVYSDDPHPVYGLSRRKVIGIMGGEPLLHPEFPALVDLMLKHVPAACHRGLWTSKDWTTESHPRWGLMRPQVERLLGERPTRDGEGPSEKHACGYLCWNMHLESGQNHHQPLLTASRDLVSDEAERWKLIEDCWVNREWSATVTPKGFFFCEVAGHLDMIFNGPGGLPLEPGVWRGGLMFETFNGIRRPTGKFAKQVHDACERCGACLPLPGRRDSENRDDVSASNLRDLMAVESPRARRGEVVLCGAEAYAPSNREGWHPARFIKGDDQHAHLTGILRGAGL